MPAKSKNTAPSELSKTIDRRHFLRQSAITAVAAGTIAACDRGEAKAAAAVAASHDTSNHEAPPQANSATTADEMDRVHEAGIKSFPAKTQGKGCQPLDPRMDKGVKVYELTASQIRWEVAAGQTVPAMAYNGQVPGPEIRVKEGDRVRVVLKNELAESTSIHFHGLELPNDQDGVPFITQPPIKPGETYTYEFTVPNAGSHMYHSHHNAAKQVGLGLLGAFIVEPRNPRPIEKVDREFTMILNDGQHGYTLNGKGFPATEPLVAKVGEKIRIRYMNEGMMIHPMHLHGMHMTVIDKDGWPQPAPWKCDTLNVAPGERWDVIVNCTMPGTWAFHCHILPHAESEHGMFGMVTALVVQK